MHLRSLPSLAFCLLCLALPALANDWPQWRGPNRDDISKETGLLKSWPKEGPKLLWTCTEAGTGFAGPAIIGDRLYTMGAEGDKEFLFALDTTTGKKLWSTEIGAKFSDERGAGPAGRLPWTATPSMPSAARATSSASGSRMARNAGRSA